MVEDRGGKSGVHQGWEHYLRLVLNVVIPVIGWLLVLGLGPKLLRFFMPFVIGWIIALIANPLVRFLERRLRLVRRHSSLVIVAVVLGLVIGLIYLVISRAVWLVGSFVRDLPVLYAGIENDIENSLSKANHLLTFLPDSVQDTWAQISSNLGTYIGKLAEQLAPGTVEAAGVVAKGIPAILVYSVVTILSAYFFIVYRDRILAFIRSHMPGWANRYSLYLKGETKKLIGGYFMAQFKIMFVVWLVLLVGFIVLGVSYGPLWAFLIAFLDFLPVLGTGTALMPWGIIKVLGGEYAFAAGLLLIYVLTQVIRQMIQPKLVGDTMGLNPLITLVLLYLGFKLKGLAGMILAVPLGMLFMSLYRYGAFKEMTDSIRELAEDISRFRRDDEKRRNESETGK